MDMGLDLWYSLVLKEEALQMSHRRVESLRYVTVRHIPPPYPHQLSTYYSHLLSKQALAIVFLEETLRVKERCPGLALVKITNLSAKQLRKGESKHYSAAASSYSVGKPHEQPAQEATNS